TSERTEHRADPGEHAAEQGTVEHAGRDGERHSGYADRRPDSEHDDESDGESDEAVRAAQASDVFEGVAIVEPAKLPSGKSGHNEDQRQDAESDEGGFCVGNASRREAWPLLHAA